MTVVHLCSQESGSEAEIKAFCSDRYHVTFPMFSKVVVNGAGTHPVYEFLKREAPVTEGGGGGAGPGRDLGWNFFKVSRSCGDSSRSYACLCRQGLVAFLGLLWHLAMLGRSIP